MKHFLIQILKPTATPAKIVTIRFELKDIEKQKKTDERSEEHEAYGM